MTQELPSEQSALAPERGRWRFSLNNLQIILIALVVVGGRLVIDFSQRIVEGQQKTDEQSLIESEIEALLLEREELEAAKTYYSSEAFIEVWAHDEGKMVRDGEVLVVPLYTGNPLPQAQLDAPSAVGPTPSQTVNPWRVWWGMFFDVSPPADSVP